MADIWDGKNGNWGQDSRWSFGTPPGPADTADITAAGKYTVTVPAGQWSFASALDLGGTTAGSVATLRDQGTLVLSGDAALGDANLVIGAPGALILGGSVTELAGATAHVTVKGLLVATDIDGSEKVKVDGGTVGLNDKHAVTDTASASFVLSASGTLAELSPGTGGVSFADASTDLFTIDSGSFDDGAIRGFGGGNEIDLSGLAYHAKSSSFTLKGDVLTVKEGSKSFVFTDYKGATSLHLSEDRDGGTLVSAVTCFLRGTRLGTPAGMLAVEMIQPGDTVLTEVDGRIVPRPVRWVGHRSVDLRTHADPELAQPIRIRRNAFASGLPARDLLVSPDHAIAVDGVLIPARLLVNGSSIVREATQAVVQYWHIELDEHAVVLAEGLPAESYLDTGNRAMFDNAAPGGDAPAMDEDVVRAARSCRPFVTTSALVEPAWRRLSERAASQGWTASGTVTRPDPRHAADGDLAAPTVVTPVAHAWRPDFRRPVGLATRPSAAEESFTGGQRHAA